MIIQASQIRIHILCVMIFIATILATIFFAREWRFQCRPILIYKHHLYCQKQEETSHFSKKFSAANLNHLPTYSCLVHFRKSLNSRPLDNHINSYAFDNMAVPHLEESVFVRHYIIQPRMNPTPSVS